MKTLVARLSFVLALVVATAVPLKAHADDPKAVRKVEDVNRAAMEDYDLLEFESAKKQLGTALELVKKSKLDKNPVAAKTHMNLGIVYGGGLNDNDNALAEFKAALAIDPTIKLNAAYKTPALTKVYDAAKSSGDTGPPAVVETGGEPSVTPSEPATPAMTGLHHTVPDGPPAGADIIVSVKAGSDIKARSYTLYYRAGGTEKYASTTMKPGADGYDGKIPAKVTNGDAVNYYIEAKSGSKVLASDGNAAAPNTIAIAAKGVAVTTNEPPPPEDENPIAAGGSGDKKPPSKPPGDDNPLANNPDNGNPDNGNPDNGETPPPVVKVKKWWIGVFVGTGGGYIHGQTEVSHQEVSCCVAPAPFHVMPELGFFLKPQLTFSILARLGFPLGANVVGAATLAPAAFLRLGYFLRKDAQGVYFHGDLGGGFIRTVVKLKANSATAAQGDTDTFATGPLFVGGGFGWVKPLSNKVRFVFDLNLEAGIPVISKIGGGVAPIQPGFSINADINLGLQLAF